MTEHKFNTGDKVRCVEASGWDGLLERGATYEVMSASSEHVWLCGFDFGVMAYRFEPLPSPSQPASQWVEVDRNVNWVLWRHPNGAEVCHRAPCEPPSGPNDHKIARLWRRVLGKDGYREVDTGAELYGYIPRDSAEASKDSSEPTRASSVKHAPSTASPDNGVAPSRGDSGRFDYYTAHRLSRSDETARELTDARVGNVEARKKLVAALAKELDRPAPVRFPHPHEGRSDRVYGGRRW